MDKYEKSKAERTKHGNVILASAAAKKLVVAGPGTGKTHLFKQVLAGKSKSVTLTFINSLVADLALELCGLSDVKTLHGFARSLMSTPGKAVRIYPKFSAIVRADAKILLNQEIDVDPLFHNREDDHPHIAFYKKRKDYYQCYGYAAIVFAAVRALETGAKRIPAFDQVVVDEFQDFNRLEVSLIDLLAQKSPVILAGDDDQALYAFKHASPDEIRQRHRNAELGFVAFNLPYCSRCTRVIVDASNDVIRAAAKAGLLQGRIDKPFVYFDDEAKDKESAKNPKIVHARLQAAQIPWFIERELETIAEEVKKSFSVLIISPVKGHCRKVVEGLRKKGLRKIEFVDRADDGDPSLLDGLKLMLETGQRHGNLGWRIAAEHMSPRERFERVVKESAENLKAPFHKFIDPQTKKKISTLAETLRTVNAKGIVADEAFDTLLSRIDINPRTLALSHLKDQIADDRQRNASASIRNISIKATTVQSSKGLAADYVFITHFEDKFFIKSGDMAKIVDHDVCNFLVAITRARGKVYLVSSKPDATPIFRTWISKNRIEEFSFQQD